jgi:hypothetical protein
MRWGAHCNEYTGPARQGRRFGHGDAEKDVANVIAANPLMTATGQY